MKKVNKKFILLFFSCLALVGCISAPIIGFLGENSELRELASEGDFDFIEGQGAYHSPASTVLLEPVEGDNFYIQLCNWAEAYPSVSKYFEPKNLAYSATEKKRLDSYIRDQALLKIVSQFFKVEAPEINYIGEYLIDEELFKNDAQISADCASKISFSPNSSERYYVVQGVKYVEFSISITPRNSARSSSKLMSAIHELVNSVEGYSMNPRGNEIKGNLVYAQKLIDIYDSPELAYAYSILPNVSKRGTWDNDYPDLTGEWSLDLWKNIDSQAYTSAVRGTLQLFQNINSSDSEYSGRLLLVYKGKSIVQALSGKIEKKDSGFLLTMSGELVNDVDRHWYPDNLRLIYNGGDDLVGTARNRNVGVGSDSDDVKFSRISNR